MMSKDFDLNEYFTLGNILKRRQIITDRQLKKAVKLQHKTEASLGEILVELGFCKPDDVMNALRTQDVHRRKEPAKSNAAFERMEAAVGSLEQSATNLAKLSKHGVAVVDISDDDSGAFPVSPNGLLIN